MSGRTWKIILKLEEGRVPDRNAKGWKVEGEKKKSYQERVQEVDGHFLKLEVSWRKKGLWIIAKKVCWRTEELCPKKRETYKTMHDENFLSSWLRMDVEGKGEKGTQWTGKPKKKSLKGSLRETRKGWL